MALTFGGKLLGSFFFLKSRWNILRRDLFTVRDVVHQRAPGLVRPTDIFHLFRFFLSLGDKERKRGLLYLRLSAQLTATDARDIFANQIERAIHVRPHG